ncbi:MAG: hypothetical protein JSV62_07060 [Promethearchaeota archaeon]|nr:MAG: hypothetical protein JSV62_07060 [Candidatus Lokiarchaeota archaeon]
MNLLTEDNIEIDDKRIYITLFKLHNSFLLLISDQLDMGIGSVTLGSPPTIEGLKTSTASYSLFGVHSKLLSTIIVERAVNILKAPVLLLLFIKILKSEEDLIKPLMDFLNTILKETIKEME